MIANVHKLSVRSPFTPPIGVWPKAMLVAIAYFIGAETAFLVGTLSDDIFAPFWPPNVILFCALLLAPRRHWWIYIAAAFPAHVVAELGIGMPAPQWSVAFASNCVVAVLNAYLVQIALVEAPWLGSLRKASLYILITAVASPAVAALGGAFVPIFGGGAVNDYFVFWGQWYLSNALGYLTLGPIFLILFSEGAKSLSSVSLRLLLEAILLAVAIVVVCALAFRISAGTVASGYVPALLYSPLPFILWSAIRFGEKGASSAILLVTIVLLWLTLNSSSLFIAGTREANVFALQVFLISLSVPVLLLGASIDEARNAVGAIRESTAPAPDRGRPPRRLAAEDETTLPRADSGSISLTPSPPSAPGSAIADAHAVLESGDGSFTHASQLALRRQDAARRCSGRARKCSQTSSATWAGSRSTCPSRRLLWRGCRPA